MSITLIISKLIAFLILPPSSILLLGFLGVIYWQKTWGRWCASLAFALLLLLSLPPMRDVLMQPLEFAYPAYSQSSIQILSQQQNAAIIVLGGGVYRQAAEYQGVDRLTPAASMRALYGAHLAKDNNLPLYFTGGTLRADQLLSEGETAKLFWLNELGIDEQRINIEEQSTNTWENAVYIKKQLAARGINTVVLVTTAWHMRRSVYCFSEQGLHVIAAPCDYTSNLTGVDNVLDYMPEWNTFADSCNALHEYLGLLWYRIRYG
ncbi:MAG: YdcF family protein [Mariprofundales bacterium]